MNLLKILLLSRMIHFMVGVKYFVKIFPRPSESSTFFFNSQRFPNPFFLALFFFFVFLRLFLILFLRVEHNSFKMYSRARLIDHFLAPTPNEPEKSFFVCWTICYRWRSLLIDSFFSTSKLQNLGKISRKIQHIRKGNSILELFAFFFCRIGANVKVN